MMLRMRLFTESVKKVEVFKVAKANASLHVQGVVPGTDVQEHLNN